MDHGSRFRIGRLEIDAAARRARIGTKQIHLEPKAFDLLVHLARHPGQALSRDDLLIAVWGRTIASESVVAQPIHKLRQLLSGPGGVSDAIATLHGVGYRLDAEVIWLDGPGTTARRRSERRLIVAAVLLAGGLVAWWQTAREPLSTAAPRIGLIEVENATGNTDIGWMRAGGAALIAEEMSRRGVDVATPAQIEQLRAAAGGIEAGDAALRLAGIARVFAPRLVPDPLGYRLEVRNLAELGAEPLSLAGGDAAGLALAMAGTLADRVRADLPAPNEGTLSTPFLNEAYARAHHHRLAGEFQTAIELYEYVLREAPGHRWTRFHLAVTLRQAGRHQDARAALDALAADGDDSDIWLTASLANSLGHHHWFAGELEAAQAQYQEALRQFQAMGMRSGVASALGNLGLVAHSRADYASGDALLGEALAIYRESGHRLQEARLLHNLGYGLLNRRQFGPSKETLEAALAIRRELGLRDQSANTLSALGELAVLEGRIAEGVAMLEQALATFSETGNQRARDNLLSDLADAAFRRGDYLRGRDLAAEYLASARSRGEAGAVARGLLQLGRSHHALSDYDSAATYYAEADAAWAGLDNDQGRMAVLVERARLALDRDDLDDARRHFDTMESLGVAAGHPAQRLEHRALRLRANVAEGLLEDVEVETRAILDESGNRTDLQAMLALEIVATLHREAPGHPLLPELLPVVAAWAPRHHAAAAFAWQTAADSDACLHAVNALRGLRGDAWRDGLAPAPGCSAAE